MSKGDVMPEIHEALDALVIRYVFDKISVDDFRKAFAAYYFRARQSERNDAQANALANRIVGPLAEFSRGHRSEASLREELAKTVHPFQQRSKKAVQFRVRRIFAIQDKTAAESNPVPVRLSIAWGTSADFQGAFIPKESRSVRPRIRARAV
jgi:hypothetical protein